MHNTNGQNETGHDTQQDIHKNIHKQLVRNTPAASFSRHEFQPEAKAKQVLSTVIPIFAAFLSLGMMYYVAGPARHRFSKWIGVEKPPAVVDEIPKIKKITSDSHQNQYTKECTAQKCDDEWIFIKGGSLNYNEERENDYSEKSKVIVQNDVKDFLMMKTEVTRAQYKKCVAAGACSDMSPQSWCGYYDEEVNAIKRSSNEPITCTTWKQAIAYCRFAKGRLPTASEWLWAASNGEQRHTYPWGNETASCDRAVVNDAGEYDSEGCRQRRPWGVCSHPQGNTPSGICDLFGNVNEWVLLKDVEVQRAKSEQQMQDIAERHISNEAETDKPSITAAAWGGSYSTQITGERKRTLVDTLDDADSYAYPDQDTGFRCVRDVNP